MAPNRCNGAARVIRSVQDDRWPAISERDPMLSEWSDRAEPMSEEFEIADHRRDIHLHQVIRMRVVHETLEQRASGSGHPTDLVQLSDGRLLASYGVRTQHAQPEGIRACFSSDNGETWDTQTEVEIRSDFSNWDIGYPESLEFADGRVLTVYYGNLFGKYFVGGTYWKP